MQLSVLFSALISFVILAAASPAPRAISIEKLSSKREELGTKFVDYHEREVLGNDWDSFEGRAVPEELGNDWDSFEGRAVPEELGNDWDSFEGRAVPEELGNDWDSFEGRAAPEELGNDWDSFEARAEE